MTMKSEDEWIKAYNDNQLQSGKEQGTMTPQEWIRAIKNDALETAAYTCDMAAGEMGTDGNTAHACAKMVMGLKV